MCEFTAEGGPPDAKYRRGQSSVDLKVLKKIQKRGQGRKGNKVRGENQPFWGGELPVRHKEKKLILNDTWSGQCLRKTRLKKRNLDMSTKMGKNKHKKHEN